MVELIDVTYGGDVDAVANLAKAIWNEHYAPIIGQKQVDYMLERFQSPIAIGHQLDEGFLYFLLRDDSGDAGYMALLPERSADRMMLSKFYVRKDRRGRGYSRVMLVRAEELCRELSIRKLWLTVNRNNADSIAVYEHMGFANLGAIIKDIGDGFVMDDYRMEKTVRSDLTIESPHDRL